MSAGRNTETRQRGRLAVALVAAGTLVVAGPSGAEAALTTPSCLAKKLTEWGNLRRCQAIENGKALQGKPADPAKCETKFDAKLAKLNAQASAAAVACRYGVNTGAEAGTVTDYDTGLQWEQKTDDGTVHDKFNVYTWNTAVGGTEPNGTVFTAFLGTLNNATSQDSITTSGCFAGHCDWRLPAIGELTGIVDPTQGECGGGSGPCIDEAVFGPTVAFGYWSASTLADFPFSAWTVDFGDGFVGFGFKLNVFWVRGVRSGL